MATPSPTSTWRLILWPAVVTLAVTLLRLVGELEHWSPKFFTPGVGGSGGIVGITWLAPIFGAYFALRIAKSELRPVPLIRLLAFALPGLVLMLSFGVVARAIFHETPGFRPRLLYGFALLALAGVVTLPAWPRLWKTLLAYGFAARVPVALLMLLAFQGHWGTHYDATPQDYPAGMGLIATWVWLGLVPQLVLWVGYTLVSGMFFGALAAAVGRFVATTKSQPQPAA